MIFLRRKKIREDIRKAQININFKKKRTEFFSIEENYEKQKFSSLQNSEKETMDILLKELYLKYNLNDFKLMNEILKKLYVSISSNLDNNDFLIIFFENKEKLNELINQLLLILSNPEIEKNTPENSDLITSILINITSINLNDFLNIDNTIYIEMLINVFSNSIYMKVKKQILWIITNLYLNYEKIFSIEIKEMIFIIILKLLESYNVLINEKFLEILIWVMNTFVSHLENDFLVIKMGEILSILDKNYENQFNESFFYIFNELIYLSEHKYTKLELFELNSKLISECIDLIINNNFDEKKIELLEQIIQNLVFLSYDENIAEIISKYDIENCINTVLVNYYGRKPMKYALNLLNNLINTNINTIKKILISDWIKSTILNPKVYEQECFFCVCHAIRRGDDEIYKDLINSNFILKLLELFKCFDMNDNEVNILLLETIDKILYMNIELQSNEKEFLETYNFQNIIESIYYKIDTKGYTKLFDNIFEKMELVFE